MKIFVTLLSLLFTFLGFAEVSKSNGLWLGTFTKKPIGEKLFLWAETQLRYNLNDGEMGQLLYRFGPLINLESLNFELGALYGFIQNNSSKEHRYTIQHSKNYKLFENWSISTRSRLEYRIRENTPDSSQRFRVLVRANKTIDGNTKFVLWNEVFLNLKKDSWGGKTMDRNRLFIGLRSLKEGHNIEYGYLNQYVTNADLKSMGHIIVIYFNL